MADDSNDPMAAGWKRDPWSRFAGRYWDGTRWTEHVVGADKVVDVDAVPSVLPAALVPAVPPAGPARPIREKTPEAPGTTAPARRPREVVPAGEVPPVGQTNAAQRAWTTVRGWPRWAPWAAGIVAVLVLIGVAGSGGGEDTPRSLVPQTSLTLPVAPTTAPAPATTPTPPPAAPTTAPAPEPVAPTTTQATTAPTTPLVTSPPATAPPATSPSPGPSPTRPEDNMMTTTGFSAVEAG